MKTRYIISIKQPGRVKQYLSAKDLPVTYGKAKRFEDKDSAKAKLSLLQRCNVGVGFSLIEIFVEDDSLKKSPPPKKMTPAERNERARRDHEAIQSIKL
jgi:hypothetical protein